MTKPAEPQQKPFDPFDINYVEQQQKVQVQQQAPQKTASGFQPNPFNPQAEMMAKMQMAMQQQFMIQ